jgi:hypothetical protein
VGLGEERRWLQRCTHFLLRALVHKLWRTWSGNKNCGNLPPPLGSLSLELAVGLINLPLGLNIKLLYCSEGSGLILYNVFILLGIFP